VEVGDHAIEEYKTARAKEIEHQVDEWITTHSLEEKVAQMFMVTPDAIVGHEDVTVADEELAEGLKAYPVGGLIYFSGNLENPKQAKEMLENTKQYYKEQDIVPPFLATDEEGGQVSRIANNSAFGIANVGDMRKIGKTGDPAKASEVGTTLGSYLSDIGFNMDMAPDADVLTNPKNKIIGKRSFGTDAELVAQMAVAEAKSMRRQGVLPIYKHFPGHGATVGDTHEGFVSIDQTLDELYEDELIPFQEAIANDAEVIMVGHISVPRITGNDEPSSLSQYMIADVLRGQMGYEGIVITDAMNMGAISDNYSSADMAVQAVNAGVDIILMPVDFEEAYQAILDAVASGTISEERIDESVRRILRVKYRLFE
jgi:beta-N-acetylhexosaminidase